MLISQLSGVLRYIRRHLGYSSITIVGLAVGMACCWLIGMFIMDELAYDRDHPNSDRIFRIALERTSPTHSSRLAMGATVPNISLMIIWRFIRWVALAFLLSAPLAYYASTVWLEGFAYRIGNAGWLVLLAGATSVSVALAAVAVKSITAARNNPMVALRHD